MDHNPELPESADLFISESMRRDAALADRLRTSADRLSPEVIRARLADPPQRAEVTGNPLSSELKAETADATVHLMASSASGSPKIASGAQVRNIEQSWNTTDSTVDQFYDIWPEVRWFDLLQPADDLLRKLADDTADAFNVTTAPGVPAIVASCRVTEPWVMNTPDALTHAIDSIAGDVHCDLQISGPTVIDGKRFASCVDWYRNHLAIVRRADGSRGELAKAFFAQNFTTFPVARGDLIILIRLCSWCLGAFCARNAIDPAECIVTEPYSDGFGSVPWAESRTLAENEAGEAGQNSSPDATAD